MQKKVEVEIDGKKVRVMEHLLEDVSRFGASVVKRKVKETPAELLKATEMPVKKVLAPTLDPLDEVVKVPAAVKRTKK